MHAQAPQQQTAFVAENRRAIAGFFVSGILISFLGAILPAWGYHVDPNFVTIGYYFLFLNVGILAGVRAAHEILPKKGIRYCLITGSLVACGAFLYLAAVGPPFSSVLRHFGLFLLGGSAGLLNTSIFHAITALYKHDPAATVNLGGILLALGCVTTALLISGAFYVYTVPSILILFAVIPGLFAIYCAKGSFSAPALPSERPLREALRDFTNPTALLFSLLLFFQFGNEWSIAGWLAIFLIRRLGVSPATALMLLALYWTALLAGRILARSALGRFRHNRLLASSAIAALFGCLMLTYTAGIAGAAVAIVLVGLGFAAIYPIVVERIGHHFTYYHPGFYNGIFSFAFTGGLLAPWILGYFAASWGIRSVMLIPTAGMCVVVVLVLLISLEAQSSGQDKT